eukprot:g20065.t1
MDDKKEESHLLGVSPRGSTPPRATLAQLAEKRLGSLQYLLQSKNSSSSRSPPSRNRPRASTATSTGSGGTGRASGRTAARRSTSGSVEEIAADASVAVARSRGLFSSSRERPRSQGSASSSGRRQSGRNDGKSTYRLSIDNNLERAPMRSNHADGGGSPSTSGWRNRHRSQPPPSSSTGSTPERVMTEAGLAWVRGGSATGLSTMATPGGTPARKLSGSSIYGSSDHSGGSYGGVGIRGTKGGDTDNDSFFGYSDDDGEDDESDGGAEASLHRRRRLQNSCCILVGVSWAAAALLLLLLLLAASRADSSGASSVAGAMLGGAATCALLGIVVLVALSCFWGLPSWRRPPGEEEEEENAGGRKTSLCCLWGRRRDVDEGGKLAEIGGVTYLAI